MEVSLKTLTHPFHKKRLRTSLLFILTGLVLLSGCRKEESVQDQPLTATNFYLNTVVTITLYDSKKEELLDGAMDLCADYEKIFSRTDPESELYKLNHRELEDSNGVSQVSAELAALIQEGLNYSRLSEGAFDITIGSVSSLWDFTSEEKSLPRKTDILGELPHVGYEKVIQNERQIQFQDPDTQLDLGAIAKGYIADKIKEYLLSQGVESAIINLGGNVLCIGGRPDGTPFVTAIQKPFAQRGESMVNLSVKDQSIVSSGIYERYFEQDGVLYHHILDPKTGYPYENDLLAVSIISSQSVEGDGLSTICMALGYQKGMEFLNHYFPDIHALFITKDEQLHYTEDFEKAIPVHPIT